jgi:glyoxylase-like metal-dependent hydrolase (beta-lactamase superfamily II)
VLDLCEALQVTLEVPVDVPEILTSASVPLSSIDAIIWSHHHCDHTGDPSLFPSTTSLVVGPNFKSNPAIYPGYPENPDSVTVQDAFDGREIIELNFNDTQLTVGGLRAIDWFHDGSFYILEALGHTSDHVMALARTSRDKFLLLGADAAHHCGEFRPTPLTPLPESIIPSPLEPPSSISVCPGAIFEQVHRSAPSVLARTAPFYETAPALSADPVACKETLEALQVFDASPDVLVIIAHDYTILDLLELYPKAELTGWEKRGEPGIKEAGRWRFLRDFRKAVEEANSEAK